MVLQAAGGGWRRFSHLVGARPAPPAYPFPAATFSPPPWWIFVSGFLSLDFHLWGGAWRRSPLVLAPGSWREACGLVAQLVRAHA